MANKSVNKLDHVNASITRWKSRLKRAMTALDKLEKRKKRIEKAALSPPRPRGHADLRDLVGTIGPAIRESIEDQKIVGTKPAEIDTGIPTFLQRNKLDPVAEQIKEEQEQTKKKKAAGRIAKMKAKKSGELSKMPLTGKAALEAIRNG